MNMTLAVCTPALLPQVGVEKVAGTMMVKSNLKSQVMMCLMLAHD